MQSFRTELENQVVEKDIIDLEKKIHQFHNGKIDEESFRSLRLARGVYGQRQSGVQMVRIKFPLGIIGPNQFRRVAQISDKYSNGIIHFTTRQDIQVHHVSLDDTPQLWSELEKDDITLREACGNTVRNITASPLAGVDKNEPFDVTPYGWTLFQFLLRNPIGQEMGRKFKIAISSSDEDTARAYMHDLGLIPKIKDGVKGFKVLIGGGLGAQARVADVYTEFLPANQLKAFAEAIVKVFDQYGERNKRNKARFKFLLNSLGFDRVRELIDENFKVETDDEFLNPYPSLFPDRKRHYPDLGNINKEGYRAWFKTNVIQDKEGNYSVFLKVRNGNITKEDASELAKILEQFSPEPARISITQNIVLRKIKSTNLEQLYAQLSKLGFDGFGAEGLADVTSCPGTQTCNLAITSSYDVANVIEDHIAEHYQELVETESISIKISGCMNACGQHSVADIGFHGSTLRSEGKTIPALQVLLGGRNLGNGEAAYGDKVIKVPSKRVVQVIDVLLQDYSKRKVSNEPFWAYVERQEKLYFYDLLKPIAQTDTVEEGEFLDWGRDVQFKPEIGIGECAGVKIDLIKTLLYEAHEKIEEANYFFEHKKYADAIYTTHASILQSAKAFLVQRGIKTNSKQTIIDGFEEFYSEVESKFLEESFAELLGNLKWTSRFADVQAEQPKRAKEFIENAERFQLLIDELTTNYEA